MTEQLYNKTEYLVDHHRWLLNHGVANDMIKNQLFMYGSLVHKEIQAVDLALDVDKKNVTYKVYAKPSLIEKINKFNVLRTKNSIISLFFLNRLIKKEGNLDFNMVINRFISDYCGKGWTASIEVLDINSYSEELDKDTEATSRT